MKELYEKLKGKRVHYKSYNHDSIGVVAGYCDRYLVMQVTNGTRGWPISGPECDICGPIIRHEGEENPMGYIYLVKNSDNCSTWKIIYKFGH